MSLEEVMQALQAACTEQNRKVYARHGVQDELYGVSYADLGKLKKMIKVDHALARALWATGVRDAMNSALIAIGIRNALLQAEALEAAGKIGKVVVDHGQTDCKTPDAAAYILKTVKRREEKMRQ